MSSSAPSDKPILDFERPIVELERKIEELRSLSTDAVDFSAEIKKLEKKAIRLQAEIFAKLSPQQQVQLSRHPARPYTIDYLSMLTDDFVELHGDRGFRDDPAIICGMANFAGTEVLVVGHQKGRNTKDKVYRNFGMPNPEGYRKSIRLMQTAARFRIPILCFIDTQGAYPGLGAEERGQAEAIAHSLQVMASLPTPIIATVIGEGGSGGALAISVANRILMMEYSVYSVITPEGCAAILWRDPSKAGEAAKQLKLTATDLTQLGLVDEVIPEAPGGAHRNPAASARNVGEAIRRHLKALQKLSGPELIEQRYQKFRAMGSFAISPASAKSTSAKSTSANQSTSSKSTVA